MRKWILVPALFLTVIIHAQSDQRYWSVGVNPLSLAEPMAAIGPCVAFRVSSRLELWGEASVIFHKLWEVNNWEKLSGYRFIFQPRYFVGKDRSFFITPDLRVKHMFYTTTLPFINKTTNDTLHSYQHRASQVLFGGGFVLGDQFMLSERRNLFLEVTIGIGVKYRTVSRKNIPDGYQYYVQPGGFGLSPHYEWDNDGTPYFPLAFRLIWRLQGK